MIFKGIKGRIITPELKMASDKNKLLEIPDKIDAITDIANTIQV